MAKALKILVCGDVEGRFNQLFTRVNTIQKKAGLFDMLFCVGNFFGEDNTEWESYKTGAAKVPVSTFVLGPNQEKHNKYFTDADGGELCPNVTYLGTKGVYTEGSGLTVAYLSGVDPSSTIVSTSPDVNFTKKDVDSLTVPLTADSKFKGVDVLLTSQWPRGVEKYGSTVEGVDSTKCGSDILSQIILTLKPRYHFCAMEGAFYERLPYRNHRILQEAAAHVTRFIALAKVGNPKKKKFIYAFNVSPLKHMAVAELTKQPPDVTSCPFAVSTLLSSQAPKEKSAQFFYDQKALDKGQSKPPHGQGKRRLDDQGGAKPKRPPQPTGPCWFCLGSPEVEKHLVVSVGTQCYLALAKGGLTDDHVLILPIAHYQSTVSSPSDIMQEIDKYKSSVKKYFRSQKKAVVFFERNYKTQHLQIQAVPIPEETSEEVMETLQGCALSQNIELHEIPKLSDLKQIIPEGAPYFYAETPTGDKLLYRIKRGFPLQFGREALCHQSLLNLPDRVDWKNCKSTKDAETATAKQFRTQFQKYDFNLL